MSRILLLGDSNIANNLQHQAVLGKDQFEFKKCTTKGLFIDKILAAQQGEGWSSISSSLKTIVPKQLF